MTPVGDGQTLADAVPDVPPTVTPAGAVVDPPAPAAQPASAATPAEAIPPEATLVGTSTPAGASGAGAGADVPAAAATPTSDAPTGPPAGAAPTNAGTPPVNPGTVPPNPGAAPPRDPAGATAGAGAGDKDSARARGRAAAGRTAEGAKVVGDRVSQAASATAQALRDTDVREIAEHTTNLIENARPFFLAAFAIVFSFLASVENHAAIGVVFAIGAILCVLGAAYAAELTKVIGPRDRNRQSRK